MGDRPIAGWGGLPADPSQWPAVVVRTYPGDMAAAGQSYAFEASQLAAHGYAAAGQVYQPGTGTRAGLLVLLAGIAVALVVHVGLGLLVMGAGVLLMFAAPVRPGALSVTYRRG